MEQLIQRRPNCRRTLGLAALLSAVTLAIYARSAGFDFVIYDDSFYIYANPYLRFGLSWTGIHWALTTLYFSNWHPLTWLVYLADAQFLNRSAASLHVINFSLHALNAGILFIVVQRLTGATGRAAFVAALFAWHPLRLESVAWISETKDDLAGLFFLLTILGYAHYAARPSVARYLAVMAAYLLALASKPSVVTLPFLLLLLDYWPLRRVDRPRRWLVLSLEKLPLVAMTAAACQVYYKAQQAAGSLNLNRVIPFPVRLENAVAAIGFYLSKTVWPIRLSIFYPHPYLVRAPIPFWNLLIGGAAILIVSSFVVIARRSMPYVMVGWLWFLGALVPMLGLVQAGDLAMADRYSYLPGIGLMIAVVWTAAEKIRRPTIVAVAGTLACIALAAATEFQLGYWRNAYTLFSHADRVTDRNYLAKAMLAYYAGDHGHADQAVSLAQASVDFCPTLPFSYHALGVALEKAGRPHEALAAFDRSIAIDPYSAIVRNEAGALLVQLGNNAGAAKQFDRAIALDPEYADARQNLAIILAGQGKLDEAIAQWKQAVAIDPSFGAAHGWLATGLQRRGDRVGAVEHFKAAIANGQRRPEWLADLAWLVAIDPSTNSAEAAQAVEYAQEACRQSDDALAWDALAAALARCGRFDDAVSAAARSASAADSQKQPALAAQIRSRLDLYRAGIAYPPSR